MHSGEWRRRLDTMTFGPARRRRRMTRALARLDELDRRRGPADTVAWPDALGRSTRGPRDRGRRVRLDGPSGSWWERHPRAGVVTVVVIVAAGLLLPASWQRLFPARATQPLGARTPPAGVDSSPSRLLPAAAGSPAVQDGFAFMQTQPGSTDPVTFDPCRPVRYVVRPGVAGEDGLRLVDEAAAVVSEATGLKLVNAGVTDELPQEDRESYQPDRYGERWAPVLVAWSDPTEWPGLAGDTAGQGGGTPWPDTHGRQTYVTGQVVLDTPALVSGSSPASRAEVRAVIVHELAHVVGAAHVPDPDQLMHEENTGRTELGAGDRAGLAALGQGACVPGL